MKNIPFVLFIATLVFAPLAFGTAEEWSMTTVQLSVVFLVFFFILRPTPSSEKLLYIPGLVPLFLLLGFMVLQLVPLPAAVIKVLSPASYQVYQPLHELSGENSWMSLSVYQKGTILEFLRIAAYGLFYILTIQLLSNGERLKKNGIHLLLAGDWYRCPGDSSEILFTTANLLAWPPGEKCFPCRSMGKPFSVLRIY